MKPISDQIKDLINIQGSHGNWNYSPYMMGLFNGMELIRSVVDGDWGPQYKTAPEKWLQDISVYPEESI